MKRVTAQEADQIRTLETRLGSLRFRTLITDENSRLMRPERLLHLTEGRGKLSDRERRQLSRIKSESRKLQNLGKKETNRERKGDKRSESEVNRKMRDWLNHGKTKGTKNRKDRQFWKAIDALDYLGVDPDDGTYYLGEE